MAKVTGDIIHSTISSNNSLSEPVTTWLLLLCFIILSIGSVVEMLKNSAL